MSYTVPIFDSASHPTLSRRWPSKVLDNSFDGLSEQLHQSNYLGACAIGLADFEDYSHELFIKQCRNFPNIVPIAGFSLNSEGAMENELKVIKSLGFCGIKVHPRISGFSLEDPRFTELLVLAQNMDLPVFLCSYSHSAISAYPLVDPFYSLVAALKQAPKVKVILLHGGDVQLLRYAELVRFNPNLLLDLSLTLMKYQASSIDSDLRFLFESFDRRICIGTDYPDYDHHAVRKRFETLTTGLKKEKIENAAYKNLQTFLGVKLSPS